MGLQVQSSPHPELYLALEDNPNIGDSYKTFEWKSFINNGYVIRAKLADQGWGTLKQFASSIYLNMAAKRPTRIVFELIQTGTERRTGKKLAYVTGMNAYGTGAGGFLEFVACDPASYWLNCGDSSGVCYHGNVSDVIRQILDKYLIKPSSTDKYPVSCKVSDTSDSSSDYWSYRLDPKTLIMSLLDWSSSITNKQTNWIVSSGGDDIKPDFWIVEQSARKSVKYGDYSFNVNSPSGNDIRNIEILSNSSISIFQRAIASAGISTTTGKLVQTSVSDVNTTGKKVLNFSTDDGVDAPEPVDNIASDDITWSTFISAIPGFNTQNINKQFDEYIDGRGRLMYFNTIPMAMRIVLHLPGDASSDLANSHNLGVSKINVLWNDISSYGEQYWANGLWFVYGFHHKLTRSKWDTAVYCYRTDAGMQGIIQI